MFVEKIKKMFTPQVRTYIYGVCFTLFPLLNAYGLVDKNLIPQILSFVLGLLGLGTAYAHRPTLPQKFEDDTVGDNVYVVD